MDNQTRIGLGSGAGFAVSGMGQPLITWWGSAPLMVVFAGIAIWGLWPLFVGWVGVPRRGPDYSPMWQAVEHVQAALKDTNSKEIYPATRAALRQAALDGKIKIRGRRETDTGASKTTYSNVTSDIPADYWKVSTIGPMATGKEFADEDWPHTDPETAYAWGPKGIDEKNRYAALRVNMRDVRRIWR